MLRLLLVTYWYPPAVGAAAQRLHAFARYLPAQGFELHVLTAERMSPPSDAGVTLHAVEDPLADTTPLMPDYEPSSTGGRLASRVRDLVFPDRFLHWANAAIRVGREVIRRHRIDAIMVSFPPASAVLAALALAEHTRLPLVLDVRDRWIGPGGYNPKSAAARGRHAELERRAIARSAAVVTVSEPLADAIAIEQGYPRERIWVIPNGYDPISASPPTPGVLRGQSSKPADVLTIAHVGTVIDRNRPDLFFKSLGRLKQRGGLANYRFRFVGNLSQKFLAHTGLSDIVETTGLVDRQRADQEMRQADALLLLTGDYVGQWGISAKLFEYLHAGRPVLCLEESPGSCDRILLESLAADRSFIASLSDADAIVAALLRLRTFATAHPDPLDPPPGLAQFSRASQAVELGGRLRKLLKNIQHR